MDKKAAFEIQFNWVFVLVAGTLILVFFSAVILKQKSSSEIVTSNLILKNIEAIFSGAEASRNTINTVNIPETKLEFGCNEYRIGKLSRQFNSISLFAPSEIQANKLITWTLDWSIPYRVTNFLYLSSPETRYVFFGQDTKKYFDLMPNETSKAFYGTQADFEDRGFDELRIITTDALAANTGFQGKKKVTALKLDANAGKLEFFEFDKALGNFRNTGNSFYLEDSSLFGAVFSDDAEMYKCSMENAFRRLNLISTIYIEKTNSLMSFYSAPPNANTNCAARHDSQYISAIKSNSASFSSIDSSKISGILSASGSLEQQNKEAQLYSCAMIY